MDLSCSFLGLIAVLTLAYWLLTKNYGYWRDQKVPCHPNPLPGFGHMLPIMALKDSVQSFALKLHESTDASMLGFYFLRKPALLVRDAELVRSVLQTNFASFRLNVVTVSERADPILSKNPFLTRDESEWKATRARIAGHLSGKKIKQLCDIVQGVCDKMDAYVDRKIEDGCFECELKEHFSRYTGEIVANAAFAIQGQCFVDEPEGTSFTVVSKYIFEPTFFNGVKQAIIFYLPFLADLLNFNFLPKYTEKYFRDNLQAVIRDRVKMKNPPNDFLQFCLESNAEGDIDSVIADVIIFHLDVYETSSSALSTVFYYLSLNKDVQDKLRAHILSRLAESNGLASYECLKNMDYMEQVIYESVRMTPPLGIFMKVCNERCVLEGEDGLRCQLEPGSPVFISAIGLHRDSRYWTDPDVFDPDRFSPENQADRNRYAFLMFGEGPRMCIGMRLGMVILKMAIVSLLTRYSVEPSSRTRLPFEIEETSFLTYIKGGLWAKFKRLEKTS